MTNGKNQSAAEKAIKEIALLLAPLKRLDEDSRIFGLMKDLGWQLPEENFFQQGFAGLVTETTTLIEKVYSLGNSAPDDCQDIVGELAPLVVSVFDRIRELVSEIEMELTRFGNYFSDSNIGPKFFERLSDYLTVLYIQIHRPRLFSVLNLLGLVEIVEIDATYGPVKAHEPPRPYTLRVVHWGRITTLLSDPGTIAKDVYDWGEGLDFKADLFLSRLELLLRCFNIPGGVYAQDDAIREKFGLTDLENIKELRLPLYRTGVWSDNNFKELGVNLCPIPADGNKNAGLALYPYLTAGMDLKFEILKNWVMSLTGSLEPEEAGFGIKLRAPHDLELVDGLFTQNPVDSSSNQLNARFEASIKHTSPNDSLSYIFGNEESSHLALKAAALKCAVALQGGAEEAFIEAEIQALTISINPDKDADGFLQKILSGVDIRVFSNLAIGISNLDGLYFGGSGGLEITLPIHENLGPISIDTLIVSIGIGKCIELTLATSLSVELGPISGSVNRIGLMIPLDFSAGENGNLGPVHVDSPSFLPPIGFDLSLDSGGIDGGGFLQFDSDNKRYTGALALKYGEIGLTAIGLITSKMSDGSEGFSLLVNIGVTFDPAIQLSFGFTLKSVGGLIGINRTLEIDVLRKGLKNQTLDSILFPDPDSVIANAQKIISDMRSVFPPDEGRYIVGPMIKIGWGTPTIITADIGIFLELPDPVRVVFMGQLEMLLPKKKAAIVTVHLDVLGVLDFEKGELTFEAALYDSRILSFSLSGDAAFLIAWKHDPRFALSLGGFHPKFLIPPPPTIFANMKRLTIGIGSGKELQLSCKAYQALTPNSLQFGARVDLYASKSGGEIKGHLGFDALFYFSLFSFEVWMSAGVAISYKGMNLASIELSFMLSGPTPWVARGKAKIEILFISITIKFCITWGKKEKATLSKVDPWLPLKETLELPESWGTVLPAGRSMVESLHIEEGKENASIVVHSAGRLEVRQNVVPLNMVLDTVANAPIAGHDRITIESLYINEEKQDTTPVTEFFARGQFEDVGSRKLSIPAFEKMNAGVTTAESATISLQGAPRSETMNYESILIKPDRTSKQPKKNDKIQYGHIEWEDAGKLLGARSKRRALNRAGPEKRYSTHRRRTKVKMRDESYCIVKTGDLRRADVALHYNQTNRGMSRALADRMLVDYDHLHPERRGEFMVIPEYEVAS